ncbi:heat shock protein beta-9 [Chanos chanos]|uniref:Heat shock protein beta-9 n=1 Tax=Chanos chanos TaxID=29144 RepID=A0A6J2W427_CHACN|nr:heat shock protein beta-11-like [Chanos chanos]
MTQTATESLFRDDPFFEDIRMFWPNRTMLSIFSEDFLCQRSVVLDSFRNKLRHNVLNELCEGLHNDMLKSSVDLFSSPSARLMAPTMEQARGQNLILTFDTQGFSMEDITVTVSGRRLEVMTTTQKEESLSSDTTDSMPRAFFQALDLPHHIDPADITCTLGEDGFLRIEIPDTTQVSSEERVIPIHFRTSLNFPIIKNDTNKNEPCAEQ